MTSHVRLAPGAPSNQIQLFGFDGRDIELYDQRTGRMVMHRMETEPSIGIIAPYNNIMVNGVAGQALSIGTSYYVGLWRDQYGNSQFDTWTTGNSNVPPPCTYDPMTGYLVKNVGNVMDRSRRLVGGICPGTNGAVILNAGAYTLGSYFNRQRVELDAAFSSGTVTGNTWTKLTTSSNNLQFWYWQDGALPVIGLSCRVQNSVGGENTWIGIGVDGVAPTRPSTAFAPGYKPIWIPTSGDARDAFLKLPLMAYPAAAQDGLHTFDIWAMCDTPTAVGTIDYVNFFASGVQV